MVEAPAATARRIPSGPWAWAATGSPRRVASSTQAPSSSAVNCGANGLVRGVRLPPVAKTLTRSAPARAWRRTARRTSDTVSHWWLNQWQCPPVTVIGSPLVITRGAVIRPARGRLPYGEGDIVEACRGHARS